jgi:hypothetical protein
MSIIFLYSLIIGKSGIEEKQEISATSKYRATSFFFQGAGKY